MSLRQVDEFHLISKLLRIVFIEKQFKLLLLVSLESRHYPSSKQDSSSVFRQDVPTAEKTQFTKG